jgi:hypothetical protein
MYGNAAKQCSFVWPRRTVSDFEAAILSALESNFPYSKCHGCFYHYVQALWRYVQTNGMTNMYTKNPLIKRQIQLAMALPLLPADKIEMTLQTIKNTVVQVSATERSNYYSLLARSFTGSTTPSEPNTCWHLFCSICLNSRIALPL